ADRRREHARADVRHVGELEQPLHGAVLAVRTVEHGKHDVDGAAGDDRVRAIDRDERVAVRIGDRVRLGPFVERLRFRGRDRLGGRLERRRARWQGPLPVLLNPDRDRLVARRVEILEDGRRRGERYFMLAGTAAVNHADAELFHSTKLRTMSYGFRVTHTDRLARRGRLTTAHGDVETPAFMPVGTQGAVKGVLHRDLLDPVDANGLGADILLSNTYHLYLRPGDDRTARRGGLHRFIGWPRPILTDGGGSQVFSPAARRTIDEEGARFRSHL